MWLWGRSEACELVNNMINHLPSHKPELERQVPRLTELLDRVDKLEAHLTANEVGAPVLACRTTATRPCSPQGYHWGGALTVLRLRHACACACAEPITVRHDQAVRLLPPSRG